MKVIIEISISDGVKIKPLPPVGMVKEGERYIVRGGNLDLLQIKIGPWQDISRPLEIQFLKGFQAIWAGAEICANLIPIKEAA